MHKKNAIESVDFKYLSNFPVDWNYSQSQDSDKSSDQKKIKLIHFYIFT